ncbi:hypothetical protein HGRIS_014344 [Hohenbuehelia grisea]|uniref:Pex19-domain-containing protein n=1 Tax=Hohenbuehelia grisea TaxID=104357 RepID=A0ABR3JT80_9AGAR
MSSQPPPKPLAASSNDDDLDDLDDVISQFASPGQSSAPASSSQAVGNEPETGASDARKVQPAPLPTAATRAGPGTTRPRHNTRVDAAPPSVTPKPGGGLPAMTEEEDELAAEFAKELSKGMESLMREMGAPPPSGGAEGGEIDEEQAKKFKAAWEAMLAEGMDGLMAGGDAPAGESSGSGTASGAGKDDFQSKIRQAQNKLKESESSMKSGAAGDAEPSLEDLLKSIGADGEGGDNEEELAGMLENMMGQLMSKEILYDPLKELCEKYPTYLEENASKLPKPDIERYELQLASVRKIVSVFDEPGYNESDPQTQVKVVEMMSEMQSYGSPPQELMGDLPPGYLGPDGMPQLPEGCNIA